MEVRCYRTGDRLYTMRFHRGETALCDVGGPGFDLLMPHDLCHFIVERELGMTNGIYGFLLALINAGWLEPAPPGESPREKNRRERHAQQAAEKLLAAGGRDEGPRSERAVAVYYEWLRRNRSKDAETQRQWSRWQIQADAGWDGWPEAEKQALTPDVIDRIVAVMDELIARWRGLEVGDYFSVEWPDHLVAKPRTRGKKHAAPIRSTAAR